MNEEVERGDGEWNNIVKDILSIDKYRMNEMIGECWEKSDCKVFDCISSKSEENWCEEENISKRR